MDIENAVRLRKANLHWRRSGILETPFFDYRRHMFVLDTRRSSEGL